MNKINLLITRPQPAGAVLLNKALSLGIHVELYSPILITPINLQKNIHPNPESADILIFTSPHAVNFTPPFHTQHQKIYAIGKNTALSLQEKRINCDLVPKQENSEGLLAELNPNQLQNKHIVIIKGVGGRNLLATTFKDWGAHVTCLDVYTRTLNPERLDNTILDKITHIHLSSLDILLALLKNCPENQLSLLKHKTLLISSSRLKDAAERLGFHHIEQLADVHFESLKSWASRLKS